MAWKVPHTWSADDAIPTAKELNDITSTLALARLIAAAEKYATVVRLLGDDREKLSVAYAIDELLAAAIEGSKD